jgi:hypothetical protein
VHRVIGIKCLEFPAKWKASVVLPVPKISSPANFTICLFKIIEVLMAWQMEAYIRINGLLTVFQSGFRRHNMVVLGRRTGDGSTFGFLTGV